MVEFATKRRSQEGGGGGGLENFCFAFVCFWLGSLAFFFFLLCHTNNTNKQCTDALAAK